MPHRPRIQTLCTLMIGAWLAFSVAMTVAATLNFARLKPEVLRDADKVFAKLGDQETQKVALRYTASELNRLLFKVYSVGQLGLGLVALAAALFLRRRRALKAALVLAFICALLFEFWLVPAIGEQGRIIDFMPREPKGKEVLAFDRLHRISVWVDGGKILILVAAAGLVCLRRPEEGAPESRG